MDRDDYMSNLPKVLLELRKSFSLWLIYALIIILIPFLLGIKYEQIKLLAFFIIVFGVLPLTGQYFMRVYELKSKRFSCKTGKIKMPTVRAGWKHEYNSYRVDGSFFTFLDILNQCETYQGEIVEITYTKFTKMIVSAEVKQY